MSFSTGKAPIPLTIPDTDSQTDLTLESSPGVYKSIHICTSLKADCLPSPADPGTWEGASSLARFGLDIGGTLCKVVYFEPFNRLDFCTASSKFSLTSAGILAESWNKIIAETEGIPREFEAAVAESIQGKHGSQMDGHEPEHRISEKACKSEDRGFTFGWVEGERDGEESDKLTKCMTPNSALQNGENTIQNCVVDIYEGKTQKTSQFGVGQCRWPSSRKGDIIHPECDSIKAKLDRWMGEGGTAEGCTSDENCLHQDRTIWVSSHDPVLIPGRGTLYFKCFETWRMEEFLLLTKEHSLVTGGRALGATGGGARKFGHQFLEIAGLQLKRADELKSLVRGIDFLVKHAQHESFEYPKGCFKGGVIQRPFKSPENSSDDGDSDFSEDESVSHAQLIKDKPESEETSISVNIQPENIKAEKRKAGKKTRGTVVPRGPVLATESGGWLGGNEALKTLYPYLVVNIGSGVSILRVDSPDQFQRVGGTSIGGSTFFGLASLLTGCSSFEEAISLAGEGDSTQIDMLVGDIYAGGDYSEMNLAATTVASSFGKLVQPARRAAALQTPQHLAKAALLMITNNIGSLAMLHARATGVDHVLFTGSFLHGNKLAMRLLAVAMEFWSKGQIKAIFLCHEGHAGAMGALLSALDPENPTDALLLS